MPTRAEAFHALVRGDRRGLLAALARLGLRAASLPYRVAVWWRNRGYDRRKNVHRAGVPVVSVGNLTLGGTGKTPCVEWVCRFYRDLGMQVAILSRGYGAEAGRNDEAMVLEENLPDVPHLQDPDRVAAAGRAVEELESELLVLDDGFQHRRLHRDLDIVLIDATAPPSRDRLFPGGTLREPVSGLKRAGVIVVTRADQVEPNALDELRTWITRRFPDKMVAVAEHRPVGAADLRGEKVGAICGIGNPAAFDRTLRDAGAVVVASRTFPDHHPYTRDDVEDLRQWAGTLPGDAVVATTQKDWVKLRLAELSGRTVRVVRIGLAFRDGQDAVERALRAVLPTE